jgi:L-seryl-tRNA(Ser) seleniumtransferase
MSETTKTKSPYRKWDVPHVINCVGFSTRVGGSAPAPGVLRAMAQAHETFIEMDDLLHAASQIIARCTGAQSGIVTCGAGAALTLAGAACLAGSDIEKMEALPDTSNFSRNRIVYPTPHDFDYDHAVRLCGATIDFVDYEKSDALSLIENAISPQTAAVGYVWKRTNQKPTLREVAELARRHNLPLIVDGALSLPPIENLRKHISDGADLVAISGGKHLGGPQASGLLFGRRDLIRSAWLQMVDMDVRVSTWSLRDWMDDGFVARPPRHGIGRSMKVSKEAIVGVLTALENYDNRDHDAELKVWKTRVAFLENGLRNISGLEVAALFPAPNGQPYPVLRLRKIGGLTEWIEALRAGDPKIILAEDEDNSEIAYIFPMQLRDDELPIIVERFKKL